MADYYGRSNVVYKIFELATCSTKRYITTYAATQVRNRQTDRPAASG